MSYQQAATVTCDSPIYGGASGVVVAAKAAHNRSHTTYYLLDFGGWPVDGPQRAWFSEHEVVLHSGAEPATQANTASEDS